MTEKNITKDSKSKKYSGIKTKITVADIVLSGVLLVLFQIFLSGLLQQTVLSRYANFYAACLVFSSMFLVFLYIGTLPLRFFSSFILEHDFGLSKQPIGAWFWDEIKSVLLTFVLMISGIELFYFVLRVFPGSWWIILSGVWILFSVILTKFMPVILIPLFYKFTPVKSALLKGKILFLARRAGINFLDVYEIDFSRKTRKANAALVGLGATRKVILSDTLTENFTPNEVISVVAHEFGHFKFKHMWKLLGLSSLVTIFGFFILFKASDALVALTLSRSISDLKLLPLLILFMFFFSLILIPAQNFFSRCLERQADKFALDLTLSPEAFVSVMNKLAKMNLADENPSLLKKVFLYEHPPISERIQKAKTWKLPLKRQ